MRILGPKAVPSTHADKGTRFASPSGSGTACTIGSPCSLSEAVTNATAGDVVFLRNGTYTITETIAMNNDGTADNPIIIESYPGETATLDGSSLPQSPDPDVWFRINGDYYEFRNVTILDMPRVGLRVFGSYNLIEGITSNSNGSSGIHLADNNAHYNIVRSCTTNDNDSSGWDSGGSGDGISVSFGTGNRIENCIATGNSDDGIDTWESIDTYVGYCISGVAGVQGGDGNGFKLGGPNGSGTTCEYCLSYSNTVDGFDVNQGVDVTVNYCTSWNNTGSGFEDYPTSTVTNCISMGDGATITDPGVGNDGGTRTNNSWQRTGDAIFATTDATASNFLYAFNMQDIGAYGVDPNTGHIILVNK